MSQVERYHVEQFRRTRGGWAWVSIGDVNAVNSRDARSQARQGIADRRICILRASPVGTNFFPTKLLTGFHQPE